MSDIYTFTVAERWHSNTIPPCGASVVVKLAHGQALTLAGDLIHSVNAGVPADFVLHGEMVRQSAGQAPRRPQWPIMGATPEDEAAGQRDVARDDRLAARVGELEAELTRTADERDNYKLGFETQHAEATRLRNDWGESFGACAKLQSDLDAANARLTENQRLRVELSERMAAAEARAAEADALTESIRQQYDGFREMADGLSDRVAAAEARPERMAAVFEAALPNVPDNGVVSFDSIGMRALKSRIRIELAAIDAAEPPATVAAPTCRTDADHAKRVLDERRAGGDARAAAEPELVRQCENCGGRAFALSDSPMSDADCENCGTIESADVAMPDVAKPADPPSDAPEGTT